MAPKASAVSMFAAAIAESNCNRKSSVAASSRTFARGTLNTVGIVGMAAALEQCYQVNGWCDDPYAIGEEQLRCAALRAELYRLLLSGLGEQRVMLNGPPIEMPSTNRLAAI